ncbi:MAG: YqgE/AlgH family protein [Puniceicoccales bacterium]|nr:YqgE/AlgH family protein [Puniceicoccales bacterium]
MESPINLMGKLLIATPKLRDKTFARTVIFLTSCNNLGAKGIILNRPANRWVDSYGTEYTDPGILNAPIYYGGPINGEELTISAWMWHRNDRYFELRYSLQESDVAGLDYIDNNIQVRAFLGHASWGPFQLIAEILNGWWYPVKVGSIFGIKERGDALWHAIIEKTNPGIMLLNDFPEDPKWN